MNFAFAGGALEEDCEKLQSETLIERPLIIAANRGPVSLERAEDGSIVSHRGSGGLVTALSGLVQHVEATWIACAVTDVDSEWRLGSVPLSEEGGSIRVQFLSPTQAAYDGYYNVIANPLLWFLQHSMWDVPRAPIIDKTTWEAWENGYQAVNRQFAEAIVSHVRSLKDAPLVMLQDYHLYLVARMVRSRMRPKERPTIMHFIHIPWPGPEYWGILPPNMRYDILDSLCAVDVLGFQTHADSLNFIRTCESYLPRAAVNFKRSRVWYRNHATHVRDFPISIDVQALERKAISDEVLVYCDEIGEIIADQKMILRIDRVEPSKNIIRGFLAYEEMLELHPEHCGGVKFVALLVPSRMGVDEYQDYLNELHATAGRINANYGTSDWEPIRLLVSENYERAVAALQQYDVLLVNAIADGMNLVAKEGPVVNLRDGVLILSEQAGARQQLETGAIIISPCDVYATAEALHQALTMPESEKVERAHRLRWIIHREDIVDWLCRQLSSINELNL